jgi:molybdopterin molybdotransferase
LEGLLDVSEAQQRLLEAFSRVEKTQVPLTEAVGRVLAKDILSAWIYPPLPIRAWMGSPCARPIPRLPAGSGRWFLRVARISRRDLPGKSAPTREAFRIMTGAPLPPGAEAVIPVEDTSFNERQAGVEAPARVEIYRSTRAGGEYPPARSGYPRRRVKSCLPASSCALKISGCWLCWAGQPSRYTANRGIGFFSTGDELLPVEAPLNRARSMILTPISWRP